jgi:hypothetical protein
MSRFAASRSTTKASGILMARHRRSVAVSLLLLGTTLPVAAEVMDKVPSLGQVWLETILVSALVIAAARLNPLLGLVMFLIPNPPLTAMREIHDVHVGPAILSEAGRSHVEQVHAANALCLIAFVLGCTLWLRTRPHPKGERIRPQNTSAR